jgi:hypothetical protein
VLGCSAVGWLNRGDHGRAKNLAEQGLRLCRETGDKHGTSIALCTLAGVAQAERNFERARDLFEEGLAVSVKLGNEADVVHCLEGLASVAAAEGSTVRGARLGALWRRCSRRSKQCTLMCPIGLSIGVK